MARTLSSTAVIRGFRAVLDAVVRTGETVRIERHGEVVAELRPAHDKLRPNSTTLAEWLREHAADPEFADLLENIHATSNLEAPREAWSAPHGEHATPHA